MEANIVYVAGLDQGVTKDVLLGAFSVFGEIRNVDIPIEVQTGSSRGFGFVEFVEAADAAEAIDNMDQSEIYGRTIRAKVSYKKPSVQLKDPKKAVWADEIFYKKVMAQPLAVEEAE